MRPGLAQYAIDPFGQHEDEIGDGQSGEDDCDQHRPAKGVGKPVGKQDRRGNRAGTGDQRYRQRENRKTADRFLGSGPPCALFMAFLAFFKNHLEGDVEKQQAAGDAEGVDGDPEHGEDRRSGQREQQQYRQGNEDASRRDPAPLAARHATRERQKQWREARRIDGHEQGDEGCDG